MLMESLGSSAYFAEHPSYIVPERGYRYEGTANSGGLLLRGLRLGR
jgi:hypothetical protein